MGTSVYIHTSPAGKVYIGIAENPLQRWANGCGYNDNALFSADIQRYGWDSFKHEIIAECQSREEAEQLERDFILLLDSENPEKGYNQTRIKAHLQTLLAHSKEIPNPRRTGTDRPPAALADYLELYQSPNYADIMEALFYLAKLGKTAPRKDGLYQIPEKVFYTIGHHNRYINLLYPGGGSGKGYIFFPTLITETNTETQYKEFFTGRTAPEYAQEILERFRTCAEKIQKGGVYK